MNMLHVSTNESVGVCYFFCWAMLTIFQLANSQTTYPSKVKYKATRLYEMRLDMKPTSVRIVEDPRYSSEVIPVHDLVFMSYLPRSEIRRIPDLTTKINVPKTMADQKIVTDHTTLTMPNNVGLLPPATIDKQPANVWWVATGSFGPSSGFPNSVGGIYMINMETELWKPIPIYTKQHYGFSHIEWLDMDLDTKSDCITIQGSLNKAMLVWLSQPREGSGLWSSHAISNSTLDLGGTDFKLMKVNLHRNRGTRNVIIVAGRRTATLHLFWVEDEDNDWTQTSNIRSTIIAKGEAYVNVQIVDVNGDGAEDILTSVSSFAGRPGRLLAFEASKSGFGSGEWRRRILGTWKESVSSYRTLAPGPAYPFFISSREIQSSRKPHILVSGADDGKVYILSPDSWSPFLWSYSMEEISSGSSSVGIPAVKDVEGDGNPEIFIPAGESIMVFRYQPSKASTCTRQSVLLTAAATTLFSTNFLNLFSAFW